MKNPKVTRFDIDDIQDFNDESSGPLGFGMIQVLVKVFINDKLYEILFQNDNDKVLYIDADAGGDSCRIYKDFNASSYDLLEDIIDGLEEVQKAAQSAFDDYIDGKKKSYKDCKTLKELFAVIRYYTDGDEWPSDMPVFTGKELENDVGVWSWDDTRAIVGSCPSDLEILPYRVNENNEMEIIYGDDAE